MDVQKWLDQFAMLDELINANDAEQRRIFEQATNTVSSADGLPHASGVSDRVGDNVVKLSELKKRKNALLNRKERMVKTLELLPANEFGVLHREYVCYMTQEQIAADMGYCTVQIWRIKKRAVGQLKEILVRKNAARGKKM